MLGHANCAVHLNGLVQERACLFFVTVGVALDEHAGIPAPDLGLLDFMGDLVCLAQGDLERRSLACARQLPGNPARDRDHGHRFPGLCFRGARLRPSRRILDRQEDGCGPRGRYLDHSQPDCGQRYRNAALYRC